jgi:hypothetical protein
VQTSFWKRELLHEMLEMMETLLEVIMRNATTKLSFGYVQKIGPPQQISHRHRQMTAWKLMV